MLSDEKPRDEYLGASLLPGVCGLDPYNPRFEVWARLTGRARGVRRTPEMERGIFLEDDVQEILPQKKEGIVAVEPADFHVHPELGFIGSHNDGYTVYENGGGRHTLEIKNPGRDRWHVIRETGLPTQDVLQAQIGAGLRELDVCDFAIHNADEWLTLLFRVPFRPELFEYMVRQGDLFWREHVLADVAPQPFPDELPPDDIPILRGEAFNVGEDGEWIELMEQYARYARLKRAVEDLYEGVADDDGKRAGGLKDKIVEFILSTEHEEVVGVAGKAYYRPDATRRYFKKELVQAMGPFEPSSTREVLEWWFEQNGPDRWRESVDELMAHLGSKARVDVDSDEFYHEARVPYFRVYPSKETG